MQLIINITLFICFVVLGLSNYFYRKSDTFLRKELEKKAAIETQLRTKITVLEYGCNL